MSDVTVLVAAGRDFCDYRRMADRLDMLLHDYVIKGRVIRILAGDMSTADKFCKLYSEERNFILEKFPTRWMKYGFKAGHIRRLEMLEELFNADDNKIAALFWNGRDKNIMNLYNSLRKHYDILVSVHGY